MKIITDKGALLKVAKVIPFIEVGFKMNESYHTFKEPVKKKGQKANALELQLVSNSDGMPFCRDSIFVGNLSQEMVSEITVGLAVDGIFDFRTMEFQEGDGIFKPCKIGSQYKPYYNESINAGFFDSCPSSVFGKDTDDDENFSDEWDEYGNDDNEEDFEE